MVIIYYIYSIIITTLTLLISLFFVLTGWWFLFLPKYYRYRLYAFLIVKPWYFLVVRILLAARVKIIGKKNIVKDRKTLYICNHQSWVDIPFVTRFVKTFGVAKKQVRRLPLVGLLIIYGGSIIVDRDDTKSKLHVVKELIKVFKKGFSVFIFPEGTRSIDGKLLEPNYAVIKLCYKLNVPVVPCTIEGTRDILPRKRVYIKFFKKVVYQFNDPLYPKDFKNDEEFAVTCWSNVENSHKQIVNKYFPEKLDYYNYEK